MEDERNYNGYPNMFQNKMGYECPCQNNMYGMNSMQDMPPYMYGKCMPQYEGYMCNMNEYIPNLMNNCRSDMYMNPYHMPKMEPLENMCGKTYKVLIVYVKKTVQKIAMDNMGMLPKSLSKDKFNMYMNDMTSEVMKKEEYLKKEVEMQRSDDETEEVTNRGFCPYCNGMLKDTLTILLVTELIKGGCIYCY